MKRLFLGTLLDLETIIKDIILLFKVFGVVKVTQESWLFIIASTMTCNSEHVQN